jgi:hypothetical protein
MGFVVRSSNSGGHDVYETVIYGVRRTVPVPQHPEISNWLLQSIIAQSGLSRTEFYGLHKTAARKINCRFLKDGIPAAIASPEQG